MIRSNNTLHMEQEEILDEREMKKIVMEEKNSYKTKIHDFSGVKKEMKNKYRNRKCNKCTICSIQQCLCLPFRYKVY